MKRRKTAGRRYGSSGYTTKTLWLVAPVDGAMTDIVGV